MVGMMVVAVVGSFRVVNVVVVVDILLMQDWYS